MLVETNVASSCWSEAEMRSTVGYRGLVNLLFFLNPQPQILVLFSALTQVTSLVHTVRSVATKAKTAFCTYAAVLLKTCKNTSVEISVKLAETLNTDNSET